jgi:hypothetical protein
MAEIRAQGGDRGRRPKTAAQQADTVQIANPFGVADIALAGTFFRWRALTRSTSTPCASSSS